MQKSCSYCSKFARYSFGVVLSTVGTSPRLQKCSPVVLFCSDCLKELSETECLCTTELRKAVNSAYTSLNLRSREQSNAAGSIPRLIARRRSDC
jgi:hypothetical protein